MIRTGPPAAAFCRTAAGTACRETAGGEASRALAWVAVAAPKYSVVGSMRISGAGATPWTGAGRPATVNSRESQGSRRSLDVISRPFIEGLLPKSRLSRQVFPYSIPDEGGEESISWLFENGDPEASPDSGEAQSCYRVFVPQCGRDGRTL